MTLDLSLDPLAGREGNEPDAGAASYQPAADEAIDNAIADICSIMETHCNNPYFGYAKLKESLVESGRKTLEGALNPAQLELMLDKLISSQPLDLVQSDLTGIYLTDFIQESYDAGHNNFRLNTGSTQICYFGRKLTGTPERSLNITIAGDIGDWCAVRSKYLHLDVFGRAGYYFGHKSNHSSFSAHEANIDMFAHQSDHCEYTIEGRIHSFSYFVDDCVFKTHNSTLYGWMKRELPGIRRKRPNTIVLLDENDTVSKQEVIYTPWR